MLTNSNATCRVVKTITERETFYCRKRAQVILVLNTPEPFGVCQDCARALMDEIAESVPDGLRDIRSNRGEVSR